MKKPKRLVVLVMAALFALSASGCGIIDYGKAAKLMYDGDYAAARSAFEALGDYKDSRERIKQCAYQIARDSYDSGDYETAATQLEALDGYKNSAELAQSARDILLSEKLVGNWRADEIDLTDYCSELLAEQASKSAEGDVSQYCKLENCTVTLTMQLTDKGAVIIKTNTAGAVDSIAAALKEGMAEYVEAFYEKTAAEYNVTMDELKAHYEAESAQEMFEKDWEMTLDEYCDMYFGKDVIAQLFGITAESCGAYSVNNGEITFFLGSEGDKVEYSEQDDVIVLHTDGKELPIDIAMRRG